MKNGVTLTHLNLIENFVENLEDFYKLPYLIVKLSKLDNCYAFVNAREGRIRESHEIQKFHDESIFD